MGFFSLIAVYLTADAEKTIRATGKYVTAEGILPHPHLNPLRRRHCVGYATPSTRLKGAADQGGTGR